ncbi:MAG: hypothetical protein JXQ74_00310, partial [Alphaproteobacteria bacterium]|nr:hypothetical protein [Alphaproteobacteria bacterium]
LEYLGRFVQYNEEELVAAQLNITKEGLNRVKNHTKITTSLLPPNISIPIKAYHENCLTSSL